MFRTPISYRYFESDMIHPNDTARDYIWELFKENYLDDATREITLLMKNLI